MALEIVGWFVSAVLSGLVNTSLEYFKNHTGLKHEVEKLKLRIPKIESVVCEAEKRQIADNPGLKEWLGNLKFALFEAEDVLDELEYLQIEKQATSSSKNISIRIEKQASSSKNIVLRAKETAKRLLNLDDTQNGLEAVVEKLNKIGKRLLNLDPTLKKLKAVVEKLNNIGNDLDPILKLVHKQPLISNVSSSHNDQRSRGPCLSKQTPILGREEEKEELINQLLCLQSSRTEVQRNVNKVGVSVIPIVGVGGVGKTTLAQLVCNDDKVKQHFKPENIWWVTVSDDFVLDLLAKKIYNAVFECEPSVNGFDFIQKKLKTELESRTFLLVLDDVWDDMKRDSWSQIISLLEHGKHAGSKILVTTRSEDVARMVKTTSDPILLTRLEEEASWELLKEVCLPDPEDQAKHPELLEIGKKIANKLNGSPLAAKVVGGMLNDELDERYWDSIYQTDMCNFDDIMSVLKMSYQHLPTYLQPLFRYCSIFPPDHLFDKEWLIYMWVGAGLILQEKDQEQDLEDLGSCYFEDLLRKSFFITKEFPTGYVMHDLLHELAQNVSAGECCRVSGDIPIPLATQHLSVETAELLENKHFFEKMSQLKHLRTFRLLFHCNWEGEALINKLLETLTSIRVLDLPEYYHMEQSTWINKLIHLRYLCTYNVSITSLGRLHLLQFLISSEVPTEMSAEHLFLPHLRHFIFDFGSFPELGAPRNLTMLRELNICLKKERGYKISELRNLVELRYLAITGLEKVSGSEEAGAANMKGKHYLQVLNLRWRPNSNDEFRKSEAVFDGLEPHVDLRKMFIRGYPGSRAPCWFLKSKLKEICIYKCSNWKDMSFLQHLPSLMNLRIWKMEALERIDTPEVSRGCQLFPKLRILEVFRCRMLKTLPPLPLGLKTLKLEDVSLTTLLELTVQDNETLWLSKMSIRSCPNLISLKDGLLRENVKLKHLKKVKIWDCPKLVHLPDLLPISLSKIVLVGCSSITSLNLSGLRTLKTLEISFCCKLESVEGLENLASLTWVSIYKCPRLPHNRTLQQNEHLTYKYVM